jgi:hypothetical protein
MIHVEFAPDIIVSFSDAEKAKKFISGYMFARRFRTFDPLSGKANDYYCRGAEFWVKLFKFSIFWGIDDNQMWPFVYDQGEDKHATRMNRQIGRFNVLPPSRVESKPENGAG